MSEVTVEYLPEDVLIEVFKWLDSKSLKNAMLTCREWADYVRRSHQWTLILYGELSLGDAEVLLESLLIANRKYNKVMVKELTHTNAKTLEIFEKHGASVHELTISYAHLTNASIWCQILNTMPNLKKVMFKMNWKVSFSDVSDHELPQLRKLKTLELVGDSTAALKLFKKCHLNTLNVNIFRPYLESDQEFWNFLATQQELKGLKLYSGSFSAFFETPVPDKLIPFRLKKLSVNTHLIRGISTNNINNLTQFMELHKNSLEDLELHSTFPENFYEFVLTVFKCLKTLSLEVRDITETRLEVNGSVTSLKLNFFGDCTGRALAAKPFISRFPNVQKLSLNGPCDSLLAKYIADNMKQLKSFDMKEVEANTFVGAHFPALESLRIRLLNGPVSWFAFDKNNPSINELWIGYMDRPIYLDVSGLARNLKLRKLTIQSSRLKCDEKFFEVIRKNCPELKLLQLNEKSLEVDISTVADISGLCFRKF